MSGAAVDPRVRDNAIDWLVRMQSGLMSAADHQALQQWRQASLEHEYAWQRVSSLPLMLQPGANLLADATARRALQAAGADPQRRRQVLKCLLALGLLGGHFLAGGGFHPGALSPGQLSHRRRRATPLGPGRRWLAMAEHRQCGEPGPERPAAQPAIDRGRTGPGHPGGLCIPATVDPRMRCSIAVVPTCWCVTIAWAPR
ncbi:FecR/PupR family sigma factor regulatory protein [Pseudomonas protegens]|nr:FecR/PupR family sigma factor regulatory protein [Pseudomonas protegens]